MTNQEMWPLGARVKFNHDNLKAQGVIIVHEGDYSVIVVLDDTYDGGWLITNYEVSNTREYDGRQGWHVPYSKLERYVTKLGNSL